METTAPKINLYVGIEALLQQSSKLEDNIKSIRTAQGITKLLMTLCLLAAFYFVVSTGHTNVELTEAGIKMMLSLLTAYGAKTHLDNLEQRYVSSKKVLEKIVVVPKSDYRYNMKTSGTLSTRGKAFLEEISSLREYFTELDFETAKRML